ncbi:hypothetical protein Pelo_17289 [Pelomyxa schiedti]|nr:hypothetical protein Pelo_17289 [Pelomyxa schiedti]
MITTTRGRGDCQPAAPRHTHFRRLLPRGRCRGGITTITHPPGGRPLSLEKFPGPLTKALLRPIQFLQNLP